MARSGALLEKQTMSMLGKRKVQFVGTLATLYMIGAAVACTGFFQNPTATTLTVGPSTFTLNQGSTQQMSATATYNDGSTKALSSGSGIVWSSSDTTIASVNSTGLVTGIAVGGPVSITGEYGTVSGIASATVALSDVTAITVSPKTAVVTLDGTTNNFTASATVSGGSPVDVTSSCTWTISNTTDFTVNVSGDIVNVTANSTATAGETATLTATYTTTTNAYTDTATITVE
jgi:hypothetical protein